MSEPEKVEPCYTGSCPPLCWWCAHLKQDGPWQCEAYPEQIPQEVLWLNVDHRQPYVGDQGIRFDLREDLESVDYDLFLSDYCRGPEEDAYRVKIQKILERKR